MDPVESPTPTFPNDEARLAHVALCKAQELLAHTQAVAQDAEKNLLALTKEQAKAADQAAKNACIQVLVTAGLPLKQSQMIVTRFKISEQNSQHFLWMINELSITYNLNENSLIMELNELKTFKNLVAKIAEIQQTHPTSSHTTAISAAGILFTTSTTSTQAASSIFKKKHRVSLDTNTAPAKRPKPIADDVLSPLPSMAQAMNTCSPTPVSVHPQPILSINFVNIHHNP